MTREHFDSRGAGAYRSTATGGVSRRRFLQAGAAVGGGLGLSLALPLAMGEAEAAGATGFAPNAFIRVGRDGQIVLTKIGRAHV